MKKRINICGIDISVERKKIKNMYIRILPPDGEVKITAPISATDKKIDEFVVSRIDWIVKSREKIAGKEPQKKYEYVSGEIHCLWGESYPLEVRCSDKKSGAIFQDKRIILYSKAGDTESQRERIMEEWYRSQLKEVVPAALERWEVIVGKSPMEWRIRNMKTRWGTCNVKEKRIWLNLQLAKKPPECLDYVIVHELVHLYVRKHNEEFKAYMNRFYPNWREVKKRLNQRES